MSLKKGQKKKNGNFDVWKITYGEAYFSLNGKRAKGYINLSN